MKKLTIALTLVFCLAAVAAMLWPVEEAQALPANEIECYYYSDATHSEVVGGRGYACFGAWYTWGTQTPYRQCWSGPPC